LAWGGLIPAKGHNMSNSHKKTLPPLTSKNPDRLRLLLVKWSSSLAWQHLHDSIRHNADAQKSLDEVAQLAGEQLAPGLSTKLFRLEADHAASYLSRQHDELGELHYLVCELCPKFLGELPSTIGDPNINAKEVKTVLGLWQNELVNPGPARSGGRPTAYPKSIPYAMTLRKKIPMPTMKDIFGKCKAKFPQEFPGAGPSLEAFEKAVRREEKK
jgi:hypothetical protein